MDSLYKWYIPLNAIRSLISILAYCVIYFKIIRTKYRVLNLTNKTPFNNIALLGKLSNR